MKKLVIILILITLTFGCISPTLEQASFEDFNKIKDKYNMGEAFSPNIVLMNDYINDISELRGKSSFNLASVLDAEIASAKAFYYYSFGTAKINTIRVNSCTKKDEVDLKNYFNQAIENSTLASEKLNILSQSDLETLRENQKELMIQIETNSKGFLESMKSFC